MLIKWAYHFLSDQSTELDALNDLNINRLNILTRVPDTNVEETINMKRTMYEITRFVK